MARPVRTLFVALAGLLAVVPVSGASSALSRPVVAAGGLIYVSGILSPPDVAAATSSDVSEFERETHAVLDELRQEVTTAGSSLADVVNVTVYLKRAADFDALNGIYKTYFPDSPPARTTVAVDLPQGALIEIAAVAAPTGTSRIVMLPAGWAKSPRPYSYLVRTGDLVFLSGLVSRRGSDDRVVPGPAAVQTRTILDNAATLLRTAGLTFDNVVAARVFLTDDGDFEAMNTEYRRRFADQPPARATAITGLTGPDASVEIAIVASALSKEIIGPQVSPTLPVSTGVRAGQRVFLSGVTGTTDTNVEDAASQATEAFAHLAHALTLAGLTPSDVVDTTLYMPHLEDAPAIDTVAGPIFGPAPPARSVVGANLVNRTGRLEILATAIGDKKQH